VPAIVPCAYAAAGMMSRHARTTTALVRTRMRRLLMSADLIF
jgi:hypothetical protein